MEDFLTAKSKKSKKYLRIFTSFSLPLFDCGPQTAVRFDFAVDYSSVLAVDYPSVREVSEVRG
jgi:hypothetical protein